MHKRILLPVDLSNETSQDKAAEAAKAYLGAFGGELTLLTVVPDAGLSMISGYLPEDFEAQAVERTKERLAAFAKESFGPDIKPHCLVAHGTIYREILEVREEIGADLIIMASHRPEIADYLIGPNAARVVRHAPCSVLVVRD